jgi:hypothetical protein
MRHTSHTDDHRSRKVSASGSIRPNRAAAPAFDRSARSDGAGNSHA